MKSIRRGIALLMAGLLAITPLRVNATEVGEMTVGDALEMETYVSENEVSVLSTEDVEDAVEEISDMIIYNTGNHEYSVASSDTQGADAVFAEDGSYTINIPEEDPFFPYEVQFKCGDSVTYEWFMNPNDSVQIGGHTFRVNANFTGEVLTQLTLNVAGSTVIAYPEEKEYTNEAVLSEESLLPLHTSSISIDLSNYTPMDLKRVSVSEALAGKVSLNATDKIAWANNNSDRKEYLVCDANGYFDFSYSAFSYSSETRTYNMIIGGDQLKSDAEKYVVDVKYTPASGTGWLVPVTYLQRGDGSRSEIETSRATSSLYLGYGEEIKTLYCYNYIEENLFDVLSAVLVSDPDARICTGFKINDKFKDKQKYDHLKAYMGYHDTVAEALSAQDITSLVFPTNMAEKDSGFMASNLDETRSVTLVSFDGAGNALACLPLAFSYDPESTSFSHTYNIRFYYFDLFTQSGICLTNNYNTSYDNTSDIEKGILSLNKGNAKNAEYYLKYDDSTCDWKAMFVGHYDSKEAAESAGAKDVLELVKGDGYSANYGDGVDFTVILGNESVQKITLAATETELSGSTNVTFMGFLDENGDIVQSYCMPNSSYDDSFADQSYVTFLVGPDVDVTELKPVFKTSKGINLYAAGANSPEVSGESKHDFSQTVQYTSSAENKLNQQNHWVSVIKMVDGQGSVYVSNLYDKEANTYVDDAGVIHSTREILLGSSASYHDIFVMNFGTDDLDNISIEMDSDVLVMDDYWTYKGQYPLKGADINTFDRLIKSYSGEYYLSKGRPSNISKLRLRIKDKIKWPSEVTGTITIKSNGKTLMILNLTGQVGLPQIVTESVPAAVKYVPYGTMIQNNNKYARNKVSYSLGNGNLPSGMVLKPNGELYGVPKEAGEFDFVVYMSNSAFGSAGSRYVSSAEFTLTVLENTDTNVDDADYGAYYLSTKINHDLDTSAIQSEYLMVSQGTYDQFVALYLDGEKLTSGSDYTSESGSTRITIKGQTLASGGSGTHTLGIEFRTQDGAYKLERAAQNYVVNGTGTPTIIPPSDIANNTTNTPVANPTPAAAPSNTVVAISTSYTVQSGDTLWKIAQKVYGNGALWNKIYADNKAIIKNPNKIYVGQVLMIYPIVGDGTVITSGNSTGNYVVQSGDTLWKIAKKKYGRSSKWRKIYKANKSTMSDPNKLRVGQVIVLPD